MGLVTADGGLEHYDGMLRVVDSEGRILENVETIAYRDIIGEAVEPWSYLKFAVLQARWATQAACTASARWRA